jgi:acetyl esterase/lipase
MSVAEAAKVRARKIRTRLVAAAALAVAVTGHGCGTFALNLLSPGNGYVLTKDVLFDEATGLELDVYKPAGVVNAPVVVFFFPGRWSKGDKSDYLFVAKGLCSRGIVAVMPNYRLYPQVRFPSFVEDSARAVAWTHHNIAAYGGDPGRVFVMGHSSGAYLAAMLALDERYLREAGGDRSWIAGMIGLAGPYDFLPAKDEDLRDMFGPPERFASTQPIHYADGTNPPLLLLHGQNDDAVNFGNTVRLAAAVERAGGPVRTVLYPKLNHGLIVASLASYYSLHEGPLDRLDRFVHERDDDSPTRTRIAIAPRDPATSSR